MKTITIESIEADRAFWRSIVNDRRETAEARKAALREVNRCSRVIAQLQGKEVAA